MKSSRRHLYINERTGAVKGLSRNEEACICIIRAAISTNARICVRQSLQVKASLRVSVVDVVRRQQPVALRSHITNLELHIVGQLVLDREVILSGILTAHVRLELSEQRIGAKHSPVHRLPSFRIKDSIDA